MILLPRGTPVKEKIDPGRINLPDALQKLQAGSFTGYLRFDSPLATGIVIFAKGRLISALFETEKERLIAGDALARIFESSLEGGATLDIYRLSPELAMSIHALLHGNVLYRGQEFKLIDIRSLLAKMKEEQISGCLRIYTDERIALIFYRQGSPLGFFHDGSTEIETTADSSMSVARLPGAKVDVLTADGADETVLADLMQSDLGSLWKKAQEQLSVRRRVAQEEANRNREQQERERRQKILTFLQGMAERHIGRIGGSLVEKEFEKALDGQRSVSDTALAGFYDRLSKAAKLVAGPSAVNAMVDEMKKGVKKIP